MLKTREIQLISQIKLHSCQPLLHSLGPEINYLELLGYNFPEKCENPVS